MSGYRGAPEYICCGQQTCDTEFCHHQSCAVLLCLCWAIYVSAKCTLLSAHCTGKEEAYHITSEKGKRKQSIDTNHRLMCFNPLMKCILRRCETRLMREMPLHQYDWGRAAEDHDRSVLSPHCTSCLWVAHWDRHGCHLSDTDYFTGWSRLMLHSSHVSRYKDWLQVSLSYIPGVMCYRSSKTSMNSPAWHSLKCLLLPSGNVRTNWGWQLCCKVSWRHFPGVVITTHLCQDCVGFVNFWMQAIIWVTQSIQNIQQTTRWLRHPVWANPYSVVCLSVGRQRTLALITTTK